MKRHVSRPLLTVLILVLYQSWGWAHGSHGSGFTAGLTHPIFGIDHNFALVATGLLGYVMSKKKWFYSPALFLLLMVAGGLAGIGNEAIIFIEKIIGISVIILGVLLGFNLKSPRAIIYILIAIFGFIHGYAHGAEMPSETTAFQYISGFVLGGVILSSFGLLLGKFFDNRIAGIQYQILVGGIFIGSGLIILIG